MNTCPACGSTPQGGESSCSICSMSLVTPHLPVGTKFSKGCHSIGRVLGQGGFGLTYQVADALLKRPVALKGLFPKGSTRHTTLLIPPRSLGTQDFTE